MARMRINARKSVPPVTHRETFLIESRRPHVRAHAALRLKELTIENQARTIRRLRASNLERRNQMEKLTTKLNAAEKRNDDVFHMLELTKEHNDGLRESLDIAMGQTKGTKEETDRHIKDLTEVKRARLDDGMKISESWTALMRLTKSNQRLSEEVEKGKEKKKKLLEKHKECHVKHRSLMNEAIAGLLSRDEEIANLKFEKQNLQWKIEDMMNPEEPKEDPEEPDEEAPPDAAIRDEEIE